MEIISFEKKTFEEISAKLDYFVQRMETLCNSHDQKETANGWTVIPYAGSYVSVREHYRLSVTMGRLPLLKSETAPITVLKTWNV